MIRNQNLVADAVVNRHIQTETAVPDSSYDDIAGYLPFYYFIDFRIAIILLGLGLLAGIIQFLSVGVFFFIPLNKKKEFRCIKCKSFFEQHKQLKTCPFCGGMVISEKDYIKQQNLYNNLYNKTK